MIQLALADCGHYCKKWNEELCATSMCYYVLLYTHFACGNCKQHACI